MALKSLTTFDIPSAQQIITFSNPSQVDIITYSSNSFTFGAISSFDLVKSDFILYMAYLEVYTTAMFLNFPSVNPAFLPTLPLCESDFKVGATRVTFDQKSGTNDVVNLTYILSNSTVTFGARASPMTITDQEFFSLMYFLRAYLKQILQN